MQYTLRRVPAAVDKALRARARAEGKSLNAVAVEALKRGAGLVQDAPVQQRDLSDVVGRWVEDSETDEALRAQHRIDKRLWR